MFGRGGRGVADHFGVTDKMDFIMGTFSKSMASIGGFIASDDPDMMSYIRYQSRTQIFSAALPAVNTVTVLACLDILENEPERVDRLHDITMRMRQAYKDIGLRIGNSASPIIPIIIGSDEKAFQFSQALFEAGVFALPAVYPAVPRGQALIRHRLHELPRGPAARLRAVRAQAPGPWSSRSANATRPRTRTSPEPAAIPRRIAPKLSYFVKPLRLRYRAEACRRSRCAAGGQSCPSADASK